MESKITVKQIREFLEAGPSEAEALEFIKKVYAYYASNYKNMTVGEEAAYRSLGYELQKAAGIVRL